MGWHVESSCQLSCIHSVIRCPGLPRLLLLFSVSYPFSRDILLVGYNASVKLFKDVMVPGGAECLLSERYQQVEEFQCVSGLPPLDTAGSV